MEFIEIIKAIIIGIVQGITEWLPISSTGHMILVDEFIKLNVTSEFMEMFLVVVQLASIMAVVVLYFHKLNPFSPKKTRKEKKDTISLWMKVIVGIIPAGIMGVLFDDWITENFYNYVTVSIMLIFYGVLFILVENKNKNKTAQIRDFSQLSYKTAFGIGIFQVLSLIPGTSRSGSTILGGIILSAHRPIAAEFSFFMSIPIMLGASLLKLRKFGFAFTGNELAILLVGMAVAFVVSIVAIKFLMIYIRKNDFKLFAWYRIVLGILVLAYFLLMG